MLWQKAKVLENRRISKDVGRMDGRVTFKGLIKIRMTNKVNHLQN
jgi:hypothetical protein